MTKALLISIFLILNAFIDSCSAERPERPSLTKPNEGSGNNGDNPDAENSSSDEVPSLLEKGVAYYSEICSGCHENEQAPPLLEIGRYESAELVEQARSITERHSELESWPTAEDAAALAVAFAAP